MLTKEEATRLLQRVGYRGFLGFHANTIQLQVDPRWTPQVWDTLNQLADAGYTVTWEAGVISRQNSAYYDTKRNVR